ncbi:MAG: hypothetical protein ABIE94_00265 [archaeon]
MALDELLGELRPFIEGTEDMNPEQIFEAVQNYEEISGQLGKHDRFMEAVRDVGDLKPYILVALVEDLAKGALGPYGKSAFDSDDEVDELYKKQMFALVFGHTATNHYAGFPYGPNGKQMPFVIHTTGTTISALRHGADYLVAMVAQAHDAAEKFLSTHANAARVLSGGAQDENLTQVLEKLKRDVLTGLKTDLLKIAEQALPIDKRPYIRKDMDTFRQAVAALTRLTEPFKEYMKNMAEVEDKKARETALLMKTLDQGFNVENPKETTYENILMLAKSVMIAETISQYAFGGDGRPRPSEELDIIVGNGSGRGTVYTLLESSLECAEGVIESLVNQAKMSPEAAQSYLNVPVAETMRLYSKALPGALQKVDYSKGEAPRTPEQQLCDVDNIVKKLKEIKERYEPARPGGFPSTSGIDNHESPALGNIIV